MANVTFLLHGNRPTTDPNKEYSIFFRCRDYQGINLMMAIDSQIYKINPKLWDNDKMRVKMPRRKSVTKYMSDSYIENLRKVEEIHEMRVMDINLKLEEINLYFQKYFTKAYETRRHVTNRNIKDELSMIMTGKIQNRIDLLSFIEQYIEGQKKRKAEGTIKNYKSSLKKLKEFNDQFYPINFESINKKFAQDYKDWLLDDELSTLYINKLFKNLKLFMNEGREEGLTDVNITGNRAFSVKNVDNIKVYLNQEELKRIENLKLSGQMELTRDLFLIGANTGMRISDFNNLGKSVLEQVKGGYLLKYVATKTKKDSVGPVNELVYKLYEKYNGNPPAIDNQKVNDNMKDIAELAEISDDILVKNNRGEPTGKVKKYTLVTSHTARRSFATNEYLKGTDLLQIMAATGHEKIETLLNYIKVTNDDKVIKMMQNRKG